MLKMKYFIVCLVFCAFGNINCYTIQQKVDNSNEDLIYSDDSNQQVKQRLYRQLRHYGVPSDVAQIYVPRGLTIGEIMGQEKNSTQTNEDSSTAVDPWSIVWYIGSFGGLIAFFLVIMCSEWCCLKSRSATTLVSGPIVPEPVPRCTRPICDTPPPGYHLFAPPSYNDSLEKKKYDVFIVPVHSLREMPPRYSDVFKS